MYANKVDYNTSDDKGMQYLNEIKPLEDILDFIENTYEIAFGDNAINKGYTNEEVLQKLQDFSDDALRYEEKKYNDWK